MIIMTYDYVYDNQLVNLVLIISRTSRVSQLSILPSYRYPSLFTLYSTARIKHIPT